MKLTLLAALFLLTSCGKNGTPTPIHGAVDDFNVNKLFTVDGCTVYRFYDFRTERYFTNCNGSVQYNVSCGKSCTRNEIVD